jgi:anti-sigma B factor antagonist
MKLNVTRLEKSDLVKVVGDIDIDTVEEVEEVCSALEVSNLVIDLTEVTFIDTSGLHFLVRLLNRVGDEGEMVLLVAPDGPVQLLIKLSGLSEQFMIVESDDAVVG